MLNPVKRKQRLEEIRQAFNAGDTATAENLCQQLLRANKADVQALHVLSVIASSRGDDGAAVANLSRCVAIDPRNATFHGDLARVHALAGRYEQALQGLQRTLQLAPGHLRASTDLADILERSGRHAEARAALQPYLDAGDVGADMAIVAVRLLDHDGQTGAAIHMARGVLERPNIEAAVRRQLSQVLGRLHEKAGDVAAAFMAFSQAKQAERDDFVPADFARDIDVLIQAFSAPALARLPRSSCALESSESARRALFIACMPRSGSTLVEQIIHAHPQAHGAGETTLLHKAALGLPAQLGVSLAYPYCVGALDGRTLDRVAGAYLQALTALAPGALRITNKHLLNVLHLGLVSLLFPGARVLHIQRDRMDNGLACFMTSLSPALMPWAGDLCHIGFAWRQMERLMAHWRDTLDLQWLDLHYEAIVDDSEAQIRRIIDFCGLPWDERCLRFWEADRVVLTPSYDQVRRPIFRSALGRWRRYEAFLGPLQQALA